MASKSTNIDVLKKAGIVAASHKITQADQEKINGLSADEVKALISVKNKLGAAILKKTAKGGKFPHAASLSY